MPIYNVTLDDTSPMLVYAGVWSDSSHDDAAFVNYANQTFHATQDQTATVTLPFNGSAVWVAGAKRGNHDQYTATLDGSSVFGNGFASPDVFQQILFSKDGLDTNTPHTLVMADTSTRPSDRPWFDIDYVEFTTGDGDSSTVSLDTSIDDTDPRVSYSSGWSPGGALTNYYFNNTFHATSTAGAQVQVSFHGSAITLYGATSTNHGNFSVSLDGGPAMALSGLAPTLRPQAILYYASGLANTSHVVSITKADTNSSLFLDFDRAVVTQFFPANAAPPGAGGATTSSSHAAKHKSSAAPIAGGVVAGLAVIGLLFFAFWMYRRRQGRVTPVQGEKPDLGAQSYADAYQRPYDPYLGPSGTSEAPSNTLGSYYSAGPGPGVGPPLKAGGYSAHAQAQHGMEAGRQSTDALQSQWGGASSSASGPSAATQSAYTGIASHSSTFPNPHSERSEPRSPESRAMDAGPLMHADDLPPEYGQVFRRPSQSAGAQSSPAQAPVPPPVPRNEKSSPVVLRSPNQPE